MIKNIWREVIDENFKIEKSNIFEHKIVIELLTLSKKYFKGIA